MMKIKVLKRFHDKETDLVYNAGEIVEVTERRAHEILSNPLGLAELLESVEPVTVESPAEPVEAPKQKRKKKVKTGAVTMTLLEEVKTRLAITGNFHDELLSAYISDVKDYVKSAGADPESSSSVGVIARGVADLWNFGAGEGKFSEIFYQRVIQLTCEV